MSRKENITLSTIVFVHAFHQLLRNSLNSEVDRNLINNDHDFYTNWQFSSVYYTALFPDWVNSTVSWPSMEIVMNVEARKALFYYC